MPGDMSKGGARAAIPTNQVYPACRDLFDGYPLAVSAVEHVPAMHSIVLMLRDGQDAGFFALLRDCGDGRPVYSVIPWDAGGTVTIESGGGDVPGLAANAVLRGVPIPRDGSLFGWIHGELVAALIVVYTSCTPHRPVPSWSVVPRAGSPKTQWPPFTDERLFGHWFWDHHRAGRVIDLGGIIAATPGTFFWAETYPALGSDSCVVASDVKTPDGQVLLRGTYLDSAALRAGVAVPTLAELLDGAGMTDLSPRFQVPAQCGDWPRTDAKASTVHRGRNGAAI
jgi:hypothetical protein